MMSKINVKEFVVLKARQKAHLYKKLKSRKLHSKWISYKTLKTEKRYFDDIIHQLINKVKEIQKLSEITIDKGTIKLVDYSILSYNGDFMGKVITKDDHIYRGIYKESCQAFIQLWKSGLLQALGEYGYIPETTVTEYFTEDYPIIIEHQKVLISESKLWNYEMIKDACIQMSIIQKVCNAFGFKLHDGHLNNVTFSNGRCLFTDIGSFMLDDGFYLGQKSAMTFAGLYRLLFWNLDNSILKRIQVYDEKNNSIWLTTMYYDDETIEYKCMLRKFLRYHLFRSSPVYNIIIRKIFYLYDTRPEYISLAFKNDILYKSNIYSVDIEKIINYLKQTHMAICTCTDIGGNFGYLAEGIYKELKIHVKTIDYQDIGSEIAYCRFKTKNLPIDTFLYHYIYGSSNETRHIIESDLVTAIDITNNIEIYQAWKFDSLLNSLSKITKKYVCITCHENSEICEDLHSVKNTFKNFFELLYDMDFISGDNKPAILLVGKLKYYSQE